jgi:hypothetical protein
VAFLLGLLAPLALPGVLAGLGVAVHEMGKRDLAQMAAGRVDPAGAAGTRRAMLWGDVGIVLAVLGILFCAPLLFLHFLSPFASLFFSGRSSSLAW